MNTERSLIISPSGIVAGLNLFFNFYSHSFVAYLSLSHQPRRINISRLASLKGRQSKPSFPFIPFACVPRRPCPLSLSLFVCVSLSFPLSDQPEGDVARCCPSKLFCRFRDRAYTSAVERLTLANPPPLLLAPSGVLVSGRDLGSIFLNPSY